MDINVPMKLALAGVAGSGKDFLSDHFIKSHKFKISKISFATPLKETCAFIFDLPETNPSPKIKDLPILFDKTYRDIWVKVSKTIREIDDTIWIRKTMQMAEKYLQSGYNIILSDLRTLDEYRALKNDNWTIVWVDNPLMDLSKMNEYDIDNTLKLKDLCTNIYINDFERNPNDFIEYIEYLCSMR